MFRTRLFAGPITGLVLSAIFASLMAVTHLAETLLEPLRVDPRTPAPVTIRVSRLLWAGTEFRNFDSILVRRGEIVTNPKKAKVIRTYESSRRPPPREIWAAIWFIYFVAIRMLLGWSKKLSPGRGTLLRTQTGLLSLTLLLLVTAKAFLLLTNAPPFLIPGATIALWTAAHLDLPTSFPVSVAVALVLGCLGGFDASLFASSLGGTLTTIVAFRGRRQPSHMLFAGTVGGFTSAAVLAAFRVVADGQFDITEDLARGGSSALLSAVEGGMLSGVAAFLLQDLAAWALGSVSRHHLLDLTDLDHPLLRKMATEAPGSWEHSRAMANLAEAAAATIGANHLLTRVGAYYHDLGKTCQPEYFVENLESGQQSPHVDLEPHVSADAIMAHVVEGARILRKGKIPEAVTEFAYTHHGTSVMEFFWHKCLEQKNPKGLSENFFRYPGMPPRTRETAILMLIDSIEAAARTVEQPSRSKFEQIVQRILFVKLRQAQLDDSGLSMRDLRLLSAKIVDTLVSVYHHRIKYPWQSRPERGLSELPLPGTPEGNDQKS